MNVQSSMPALSRLKLAAATVAIIAVLAAVTGIWIKYRSPEQLPAHREDQPKTRPLLATVAASGVNRESLLSGNYSPVVRFRDLSEECKTGFLSSFIPGESGKISSADIADPGSLFQSSDAPVEGLPYRRLIFAGQGAGRCFIYYQHGGTMYPRWCLAVLDESNRKPVWIGMRIGSLPAQNIDELREQLLGGMFRNDVGPVC
jgi:hypothetical protein